MTSETLANELVEAFGSFARRHPPMGRMDLFRGEMAIMHQLMNADKVGEQMLPSQLSDRLHISRPSVTTAIHSLEGKGYVERILSEKDRRRTIIRLTDEGRQFIESKHCEMKDRMHYLVDRLGLQDSAELLRLFRLSTDYIDEFDQQLRRRKGLC